MNTKFALLSTVAAASLFTSSMALAQTYPPGCKATTTITCTSDEVGPYTFAMLAVETFIKCPAPPYPTGMASFVVGGAVGCIPAGIYSTPAPGVPSDPEYDWFTTATATIQCSKAALITEQATETTNMRNALIADGKPDIGNITPTVNDQSGECGGGGGNLITPGGSGGGGPLIGGGPRGGGPIIGGGAGGGGPLSGGGNLMGR